MNTAPIVFISYSWKNDEYIGQVRKLAEKLRANGVDVILDQWDLKPGHDKFVFMESSIEKADKVLIMCDKSYTEKANNRSGGVGVETTIITPDVYNRFDQEKFIPVIMEGQEFIPVYLRNRIGIDFRKTRQEKAYKELVRTIYDKPETVKPDLGNPPDWLIDSSEENTSVLPIEDEILSILRDHNVSSAEIAEMTGKSINTVRRVLKRLKESHLIEPVGRKYSINTQLRVGNTLLSDITTDDEKIVLYYILGHKVRKVSKSKITEWLHQKEIHNVDLDNAFDLLSCLDDGEYSEGTLTLGIQSFKRYTKNDKSVISELQKCVDAHTETAYSRFIKLFESNKIDSKEMLFVSYLIEERIETLGNRGMARGTIEDIKLWETKNKLDQTLSDNYGTCLALFIQNDLVYESGWTEYNNPRQYTIYPSMKELYDNCPDNILEECQKVKELYYFDIPF